MMPHRSWLVLVAVMGLGAASCLAAGAPAEEVWKQIAPFFEAPAAYAGDVGGYKSPLVFDDGRPVKTPADWRKRRRQILAYWHKVMGPWPPLVEKPTVEVLQTTRREDFIQKKVRLPIAPGLPWEGYLLVPDGEGPFPAALVVYYDAETGAGLKPGKETRAFGYGLTKRGFVSLSIGWPRQYTDGGGAEVQPLSRLAYVAANGYEALATLPEVDPKRVGVVGHSFGGKWAMFAAALCEKFACVAASDPGIVFDEKRANVNYWEPWYIGFEAGRRRKAGIPTDSNPRTGAYKQLVADGRDLHELHALIAPRPFLVSGGAEDRPERWKPLGHAIAVNRLLGYENRVAMTNRKGHGPTPESNEVLYRFFEHFLKHRKAGKR
jgi:pimeloyl-ACP methyl ester carboxylesterase